jgi:hypothetical protein
MLFASGSGPGDAMALMYRVAPLCNSTYCLPCFAEALGGAAKRSKTAAEGDEDWGDDGGGGGAHTGGLKPLLAGPPREGLLCDIIAQVSSEQLRACNHLLCCNAWSANAVLCITQS